MISINDTNVKAGTESCPRHNCRVLERVASDGIKADRIVALTLDSEIYFLQYAGCAVIFQV